MPATEGEVVSVPVAGLLNEIYINAGGAQGVRLGEYFLVYNPTVRMIAVVQVSSVQERMSAVQPLAQLASIRQGDRVRRISAGRALALKRQIQSLASEIPSLGFDVVVEPSMQAIANSIGTTAGAGVSASAGTAAVPPGTFGSGVTPRPSAAGPVSGAPDLSDVVLMAKAGDAGATLSWQAPTRGGAVAGYFIYRTNAPSQFGAKLTPQMLTGLSFEDRTMQPGVAYTYRLTAMNAASAQNALCPSVEVTWTPPGGGKVASVTARLIAPVANATIGAPIGAPLAAPVPAPPAPAPAAPPAPRPAAAPAAPPAPPAPTPPPTPPVPATPPPPAPGVSPSGETPRPSAAGAAPRAPAPPAAPAAPAAAGAPAAPGAEVPADVPAPERVTAELEGSTVVVKWNPVASRVPLAGYVVYRAFPGDDVGAPLNSAPTKDTVWRDRTAKEGTTYVFWVVAQTLEGKQSPASAKQKVEVPRSGGVVPFF